MESLPGIHGASFAISVFDGGAWSQDDVTVPGKPRSGKDPRVALNVVGPAYLDVMKIPILLGRSLSARDNEAPRKVAVMNETMAGTHFSGVSPIGRSRSRWEMLPQMVDDFTLNQRSIAQLSTLFGMLAAALAMG